MKYCEITNFPECPYALQEGYNTLSTNLTFAGSEISKVLISSTDAADGKSQTAMNLMRTLAALEHTVILVDLDLCRSRIRADFGLSFAEENPSGASHYLAGMCGIHDAVYATNIPKAYIVPVGRTVKNSLQLLMSERLPKLLNVLSKTFDYVIIDAPPIGVIIDAAQIASYCDGALLIVRYNNTRKKNLVRACEQLTSSGCPVLGAVLNDVEVEGIGAKYYYGRGYYAKYGYRDHADEEKKGFLGLGRRSGAKKASGKTAEKRNAGRKTAKKNAGKAGAKEASGKAAAKNAAGKEAVKHAAVKTAPEAASEKPAAGKM